LDRYPQWENTLFFIYFKETKANLVLLMALQHSGFPFFKKGLAWTYPTQPCACRFSTSKFSIGDSRSMKRQFAEQDVIAFSQISQDYNPIHLSEAYVKVGFRRKRIVQGMLLATMFSSIFGNWYPGEGSIYLSQSLKFLHPGKKKKILQNPII
jgi:hypothetical protein